MIRRERKRNRGERGGYGSRWGYRVDGRGEEPCTCDLVGLLRWSSLVGRASASGIVCEGCGPWGWNSEGGWNSESDLLCCLFGLVGLGVRVGVGVGVRVGGILFHRGAQSDFQLPANSLLNNFSFSLHPAKTGRCVVFCLFQP